MGCDVHYVDRFYSMCGFNPRTRMGCDFTACSIMDSTHSVSIHAPAWGATANNAESLVNKGFQSTHPHGVRLSLPSLSRRNPIVSIHAPAWGATFPQSMNNTVFCGFNPRTRMGCDISTYFFIIVVISVSIHAPAWGATYQGRLVFNRIKFQSTHPHGVRLTMETTMTKEVLFQSTHPHGVRPRFGAVCKCR